MIHHKRLVFGGLIALSVCFFIALAIIAHASPPSRFDIYISQMVQQKGVIDLKHPMTLISIWGNSYIPFISVIVVCALFWLTSHRAEAKAILGVLIADSVTLFIKWVVNRPRPPADLVEVFQEFHQTSFPSGHVVHYVTFFGFLLAVMLSKENFKPWLRWSVGICCIIMLLGVSVSRIFLGAHWVSDVVGGYLMGAVFLTFIMRYYLTHPRDV